MKTFLCRRPGLCILMALSIPFGVMFFMGSIHAQGFRPPPRPFQPRQPGFQPGQPGMPRMPRIPQPRIPKFETVWTCSRCNAELGRGNFKPNLGNCPKCGARFSNSFGPISAPNQPQQPPNFQPPMQPPVTQPPMQPPAFQPQQPKGQTPPAAQPPQPNFNPNPLPQTPPATNTTSNTASTSSNSEESGGGLPVVAVIIIVVVGIALLAGVGVAIFVKATENTHEDGRDPYRKKKYARR